jgi:hypothetical protein
MVKLISTKRFKLFTLFCALLINREVLAQIDYESYYRALNVGNYSASVSIATEALRKPENISEKAFAPTVHFALNVAAIALKASDFRTYDSIRPIIDSVWKDPRIAPAEKTRIAILADVLHISNQRLTRENRRQLRDGLEKIYVQRYLSEDEQAFVYNALAKFSIEEKEYTDAERYALNGLTVAAGRGNVFPGTLYENLAILARLYNDTGRRANNKAIGSGLEVLESQKLIPGPTPGIINSIADILYILAETGQLERAETLFGSLEKDLQTGVFAPKKARAQILYSRAIIAALKGETEFFDDIEKLVGKYFGSSDLYKNKEFDTYRLVHAYSKINAGLELQENDLYELDNLAISEDGEIFRKVAKLISAKNPSTIAVTAAIDDLKNSIGAFNNAAFSEYMYEKGESIFTAQIQNTLFAYLKKAFDNSIPSNISRSVIEFLFQTETLKVDYLSKIKNISLKFKNKESKYLVESYYKLTEEKNILIGKLISIATKNAHDYAKRRFQRKDKKDDQISFRFKYISNSIDSIYEFVKNQENYNGKQIFSSAGISLSKVKSLLGDNADFLFYKAVGKRVFTCIISKDKHRCHSRSVDSEKAKAHVEILYNAASNPPTAGQSFPDASAEYIYKLLLGDYAPSKERLLLIKPAAGDLKLPYRALRSAEWEKGDYLGLKTQVAFLSSLFSTAPTQPSDANLKKYLGVGDPRFQQDNSDQIKMSGLFTIRSASMADQLAALDPLPDTKNEILQATENFSHSDYEVLLGVNATELEVRLAGLHRFKVLHFATHGLVSGEFTGLERPSLALSTPTDVKSELEDGLLTSNEIAELKIHAELVILSACQTVTDFGQPNSFGFNGLTSAFLRAGAQSVLGTQWKIESKSAAAYIGNVVREVVSAEKGPAYANSEAARILARKKEYEHPFYWAPYVIVQGWPNNRPTGKSNAIGQKILHEAYSQRSTKRLREVIDSQAIGRRLFVTVMDTPYGKERVETYFGEYSDKKISLKRSRYGSLGIVGNDGNDLIFRGARFETNGGITPILGRYNFDADRYQILYEFDDYSNKISVFNSVVKIEGGYLLKATAYEGVDGDQIWRGYIQLNQKFVEIRRFSDDLDSTSTVNDNLIRDGDLAYRVATVYSENRINGYSLKLGYNPCSLQYDVRIELFDHESGSFTKHRDLFGFSNESIVSGTRTNSVIFEKGCGNQRYFIWTPGDEEPAFFSNMPLRIWSASKLVSKAGNEFLFLNAKYQISNLHRFGLPTEYVSIGKIFSNRIKSGIKDAYMTLMLKKEREKFEVINVESGRLTTMLSESMQIDDFNCALFGVKNRNIFSIEEFSC